MGRPCTKRTTRDLPCIYGRGHDGDCRDVTETQTLAVGDPNIRTKVGAPAGVQLAARFLGPLPPGDE